MMPCSTCRWPGCSKHSKMVSSFLLDVMCLTDFLPYFPPNIFFFVLPVSLFPTHTSAPLHSMSTWCGMRILIVSIIHIPKFSTIVSPSYPISTSVSEHRDSITPSTISVVAYFLFPIHEFWPLASVIWSPPSNLISHKNSFLAPRVMTLQFIKIKWTFSSSSKRRLRTCGRQSQVAPALGGTACSSSSCWGACHPCNTWSSLPPAANRHAKPEDKEGWWLLLRDEFLVWRLIDLAANKVKHENNWRKEEHKMKT